MFSVWLSSLCLLASDSIKNKVCYLTLDYTVMNCTKLCRTIRGASHTDGILVLKTVVMELQVLSLYLSLSLAHTVHLKAISLFEMGGKLGFLFLSFSLKAFQKYMRAQRSSDNP